MKRIFLLSLVFCALVGYAQEVRLPDLPKNRTRYTDYREETSGYWSAITVNGATTTMFNRKNMQNVGADWVNGYRFSEFLRVGIGAGVRYYINNDNVRRKDVSWSFPIFADVRGNFISQQDRGSVPFWSVDLGGEFHGGVYFSPTLGYRFGAPRGCFILGISYTLQQFDTWRKDNEPISGVSLKLGYEF
ncbi:MAG: hypothetical protein LUI08_05700 [Prevotella sp.]|nr:hypothetical protein [Prevotella sp.]